MELKVNLTTITKCCPKGKEPYTRIDYIATDKPCKSEKVKGYIVLYAFLPITAFDKLDEKMVNKECTLMVETVENPMNPMKPKTKITGIKYNNAIINLL